MTDSLVDLDASELKALFATADRRALAALVTHLAGDPDAIADVRDRDAVFTTAVEVLAPYIRGEVEVEPPTDEVLRAAMEIAAGEHVPWEYASIAREAMGLGPVSAPAPLDADPDFSVAIIGAGVNGILAGVLLEELGLTNFTILEKDDGPGGTWRQNTYPGCRVDTPSLLYSFAFAMDHPWPEHFSHQPALLDYLEGIVESSRFGDRLRCGVAVESMVWDDETSCWRLGLLHDDGRTEQLSASAVIGATGLLRVPKYPMIENRESFAGPAFHSTHWDHSVDVAGKRVAVIGTGASANQIVPAIAGLASEVVVFQRSPHWILAHPQYGQAIAGTERQLVEELPGYRNWYRFRQFWVLGDRSHALLKVDPTWPHPERAANEASDLFRAQLTAYLESELAGRDDLIEKVLPDYPVFGKRMIIDNGWYKALRRDDVKLVTDPIMAMTPHGIQTSASVEEVDIVVYATGFEADRVLHPIAIAGTRGIDVRAQLEDRPEAYLGMFVENCPNLFVLPGPNGVPGHGGNAIFYAECQLHLVVECLRVLLAEGFASLEVTPAAVEGFVDEIVRELDTLVWGTNDVSNWFRGDRDRVTAILPKRILDLWQATRSVDRDAFTWSRRVDTPEQVNSR